MRLTPIVVLVDDVTLAKLQPLVTDLATRWAERMANSNVPMTMALNGWTPESIAWGKVLAAVAADDVELQVGE